ncbi:GNAT family N-acetyltransferase [Luteimonas sp. Y-2-2-4F]|nr:GNAT family N-acetyltransferase [Luteimonas sp. Y-2-2-4F]MCD9032196.1 GNAT family N-acetyltransferase [Luteimonas sp. Y-2-2-4F]
MAIGPPGPLDDTHRLDGFRCTYPGLARWLIERARKQHQDGASRCFVACDAQRNVIGYYALAAGSLSHAAAPDSVRRNMPDPIPVAVLGRLAVHEDWAGRGIGSGLLKDAVLRVALTARELGIRALLCHAIDETARAFYLQRGLTSSPVEPSTVMLSLPRLLEMLRAR